jgi:UDP-2-acetamido-3-amino-2,3-dideoxy-glucuronate N-acetyltransferase
VLPYALFVGNPAKQVGWISEVGCTLKFDNQGQAICPESKQAYQLLNNNVSKVS